ncbi:MAG: hypothetical protein EHM39_13545 [Chloroflexi bacterium]|nr:MAG: hypothetical protein EHM39_13545 [Chloroflexota bacterium]
MFHENGSRSILLYYTGITRLAKNILEEIVEAMFRKSPSHLKTLAEIAANAEAGATAIEQCDYDRLAATIRNSWELNQRLDPGTNPPSVQQILERVSDLLAGAKLLGAGGGGYLLMLAKDREAAVKIRELLAARPPNARARFIEFALSDTGLEVTRS